MNVPEDLVVAEVLRLASAYATARERRHIKRTGLAPLESMAQIDRRIAKSRKALAEYVRTIGKEQRPVIKTTWRHTS